MAQAADQTRVEQAEDLIEVQVLSMAGDVVHVVRLLTTATVGDLVDSLPEREENCCRVLLSGTEIITENLSRQLRHVLEPPEATVFVQNRQFFRLAASKLSGAHVSNPAYFKRVDQGTDMETLKLKSVCWYSIGGTFEQVPAGRYRFAVQAAKEAPFTLHDEAVAVSVNGKVVATWRAQDELKDEMQAFYFGDFDIEERGDVKVKLDLRDGNWASGIVLKSIDLQVVPA